MIQICDDTLVTPLSFIYTNCIKKGVFPKPWKRANVVPVYKKKTVSSFRKITDRYLSFLFSPKYLK